MFNYPELASRLKDPTKAEQFCDECNRWYPIPIAALKEIITELNKKGMVPFTDVKCKYCDREHYILLPGKYDHPLAAKAHCNLQYYEWKSFPKTPKKVAIKVEVIGSDNEPMRSWVSDINPLTIDDDSLDEIGADFGHRIADTMKTYVGNIKKYESKRKK